MVWLIAVFGWTASALVWTAKIYSLRRNNLDVPDLMYVFTAGAFVFAAMSAALFLNYDNSAEAVRWMFALSSLGFLSATLVKVKR